MKREIKITQDGSKTIYINDLNENYHSHHGALQEAKYVFIENGLTLIKKPKISILEMGLGTGLNVLCTLEYFFNFSESIEIQYFTIEKYPVTLDEVNFLKYDELFNFKDVKTYYQEIHQCDWNKKINLHKNFVFNKIKGDFFNILQFDIPMVDLVYYDCFGARVQPDLWEEPLLKIVTEKINSHGLLTTYSSKGSVRRILSELGLRVEKKPGPPGKREMINAWK